MMKEPITKADSTANLTKWIYNVDRYYNMFPIIENRVRIVFIVHLEKYKTFDYITVIV